MEAVFGTHYNLFAGPQKPQICVARRAEPKREIKLVFHHPNLLFLNPRGERSREEVAKEAELRIVRDIEQRRSWEKLGRYRHSKTELPQRCRTSNEGGQQRKERRLEICGRSSCLKNDQQEEPKTPTVVRTHCSNFAASFCSKSKATDSGVFQLLERVEPQRRMQTWGELLGKSNKFAVRLDMYLSMSKKTRKYGGGKENLHKL